MEVASWHDPQGFHLIVKDITVGLDGVMVHYMTGEHSTKRYIVFAEDVRWALWPKCVLDKVRLPVGIPEPEVKGMRADEKQFNENTLAWKRPDDSLECFYWDELRAARAMGVDFGLEMGLWP